MLEMTLVIALLYREYTFKLREGYVAEPHQNGTSSQTTTISFAAVPLSPFIVQSPKLNLASFHAFCRCCAGTSRGRACHSV